MKGLMSDKLNVLGKSPIELNKKNRKKIYQYMPVPNNYLIYWADMRFGNNPLGAVITDNALITKFEKIKRYKNKRIKKQLFKILRWNDIEFDKLSFKQDGKQLKIYYYKDILTEINYNSKVIEYFNDVKSEIGNLNIINNLMEENEAIVERNNEKTVLDRIYKSDQIETKYCDSGEKCINECFDKENQVFRHYNKKEGKPIKIEVPKDMYVDAVKAMKTKIKEGKIPSVTDLNEVTNIVERGKLTYNQAKNIAKSGAFESITYDSKTGNINCSFVLGMTFLVTFSVAKREEKDNKEALKCALFAGIQVFGRSFINDVLAAHISRSSINDGIQVSNYIVDKIGYKSTRTIARSIRRVATKKAIFRGAIKKPLPKILRSNIIIQAVVFALISVPDTYRVFNSKISRSQYVKNMLTLIGGMIAAGFGVLGASLIMDKIAIELQIKVLLLVGIAVEIVAGAVAAVVGSYVIKIIGDMIVEDDTIRLARMYNEILIHMVFDFMFSEKEIDELIAELSKIKSNQIRKMFKQLQASSNQEEYIYTYLNNYFNNIMKERPMIVEPNEEEIANAFISIGNELQCQ